VRARWLILIVLGVALVGAFVFATAGPPPVTPNPPGTFAFGALGDAPYDIYESARYPLMLEDLDRHDLAFSIHIGDIFWRPCSEQRYQRSFEWFNKLRQPLIYVPGDNEWADCWTRQEGGFDPRDRLALLRRVLYPRPGFALGRSEFPLETQSSDPAYAEFVEHARWSHEGIVFGTIHVVGSNNFTLPFPKRTSADDEEARRRLTASLAWLREIFARAKSESADAVVVGFHADPGFDGTAEDQAPFKPLLDAFEDEAVAFGKPVLLIHGDSHQFIHDQPLKARATGRALPNILRLEVPGSPAVGWVRVTVTPGRTPSFTFEQRIVPFWKFW
jgi:calcineurin-like phosphoesterase family protein